MIYSREEIKKWFERNDRPSEEQFSDVWDSFIHKDDELAANIVDVSAFIKEEQPKHLIIDANIEGVIKRNGVFRFEPGKHVTDYIDIKDQVFKYIGTPPSSFQNVAVAFYNEDKQFVRAFNKNYVGGQKIIDYKLYAPLARYVRVGFQTTGSIELITNKPEKLAIFKSGNVLRTKDNTQVDFLRKDLIPFDLIEANSEPYPAAVYPRTGYFSSEIIDLTPFRPANEFSVYVRGLAYRSMINTLDENYNVVDKIKWSQAEITEVPIKQSAKYLLVFFGSTNATHSAEWIRENAAISLSQDFDSRPILTGWRTLPASTEVGQWDALGDSFIFYDGKPPFAGGAPLEGLMTQVNKLSGGGFNVRNHGVGGYTMKDIFEKIESEQIDFSNSKLITIHSAINDIAKYVKIGIPGTVDSDLSENTYCNNLRKILDYIYEQNKDAMVVLLSPPQTVQINRTGGPYGQNTVTLFDFSNAMRDVANLYGIRFIDAYREAGVNWHNKAQYTVGDNLHPNNKCYEKWAYLVWNRINPVK